MADQNLVMNVQAKDNASSVIGSISQNIAGMTQQFQKMSSDLQRQSEGITKGLDKIADGLGRTQKEATKSQSVFSNMTGSIGGLSSAIGGLVGGGLLSRAVSLGGDLEMTRSGFDVMINNQEKVNTLMTDTMTLANQSPYEFPDLAKNEQALLAYGVAQEDLLPTMGMLGDISLGNKDKLSQLSLAYGQVASKGRLMGSELLQFTNAGIPLTSKLAEMYGVTNEKMADMISNGKIGFPAVKKVMSDLTQEGGMFFQGMDKASKTLPGVLSTLSDSFQGLLRNIVGVSGTGEIIPGSIIDNVKSFSLILIDISNKVADRTSKNPQLTKTILMVGGALLTLPTVIGLVTTAWAGFTAIATMGFAGIITAISPVVLVIGGIIVAVGLLYAARTTNFGGIQEKVATFVNYFSGAFENIKSFFIGAWVIMGDYFGGFISQLGGNLSTFFSGIGTVIGGVIDLFKGNWSEGLSSIWQGTQDIFSGIIGFISTVIQKAVQIFILLGKARFMIIDNMNKIVGAFLSDLIRNIPIAIKYIVGLFGKMGEFISNVRKSIDISAGLNAMGNKLYEWGTKAFNYVKNLATNIYNSIKNALSGNNSNIAQTDMKISVTPTINANNIGAMTNSIAQAINQSNKFDFSSTKNAVSNFGNEVSGIIGQISSVGKVAQSEMKKTETVATNTSNKIKSGFGKTDTPALLGDDKPKGGGKKGGGGGDSGKAIETAKNRIEDLQTKFNDFKEKFDLPVEKVKVFQDQIDKIAKTPLTKGNIKQVDSELDKLSRTVNTTSKEYEKLQGKGEKALSEVLKKSEDNKKSIADTEKEIGKTIDKRKEYGTAGTKALGDISLEIKKIQGEQSKLLTDSNKGQSDDLAKRYVEVQKSIKDIQTSTNQSADDQINLNKLLQEQTLIQSKVSNDVLANATAYDNMSKSQQIISDGETKYQTELAKTNIQMQELLEKKKIFAIQSTAKIGDTPNIKTETGTDGTLQAFMKDGAGVWTEIKNQSNIILAEDILAKQKVVQDEYLKYQESLQAKLLAQTTNIEAINNLYKQHGEYLKSTTKSASLDMINSLAGVANSLREVIALRSQAGMSSNAIDSGVQSLNLAQRFSGGPVTAGNTYLVGENSDGSLNRTSELFVPKSDGYIYNANQTKDILGNKSNGGSPINISINMGGVQVTNQADERRLADTISEKIKREIQLAKLGIY